MPDERPNLILITTDQQRFDALARAGNPSIFTPHLNWLVDQGVHFRRGYTDCPICVPARSTIMTGRHGYKQDQINNGGTNPPQSRLPTLPGLLSEAGYQTRAVGKMHFSPVRACYGFEHMDLTYDYVRQMARQGGPQPWDHGVGQNEMEPVFNTVDESRSSTRWIVDKSIDFIETRDPTRPFFMWTSFGKPHPPYDCDPKYWSLYDNIPMPGRITGDWSESADDLPNALRAPTRKLNRSDRFSDAQLAASQRAYYACITQIDYNLGVLFARLREMALTKNTWIVFTSDHGDMLGDHWLGAKSVYLEPSAHVPLIVRPPAADWSSHELQGTTCDSLACLADLLPTFANRAGASVPDGVDGLDLTDLAQGRAQRPRLMGASEGFAAVIEDRLKYQRALADGSELLFDLIDDPHEQHDLCRDADYADPLKRLGNLLDENVLSQLNLKPPQAQPPPLDNPASRWPGFHSRSVETDVLH